VGILHAVGDSKHPLYYLIFATFINIGLDLLFVAVLGMGVGAAAMATTISQGVSALLCFFLLLRTKEPYKLELRAIRFDFSCLKSIVHFGLPSGIQNSVIGFANLVVQTNINSFGSAAMAGCGAHTKLEGFAFLPVVCFSQALSTFVSQNLGAKQYNRVKKGIVFGVACGILMAESYGVIAYFFAPSLIRIFNDAPAVVEFGSMHMRTISLFYFLMAFSHCMAAVFRGAGKAAVPMYTMLAFWCVVRILYIRLALPVINELTTVSWAYPITWLCSSIVFLIYYNKAHWMEQPESHT
jgi:putative MATE family efflux protein